MAFTLPTAPAVGSTITNGSDLFYWNGSSWNLQGSAPVLAMQYGEVVQPSDIAIPPGTAGVHGTTLINFTLPSAGIWRVTSQVFAYGGATSSAAAALYDGATEIPNSEFGLWHTNSGINGCNTSSTTYVTVTGATAMSLKAGAWTAASNALSNNANGRSKVTYELMSGNVATYYQAGGWVDAGNLAIAGTTTAPTKGTVLRDIVRYRDLGSKAYEVEFSFAQSTAGGIGSGWYLFSLPAGLSFNLTKHPANQSATGDAAAWAAGIPSSNCTCVHIGTNMHNAIAIPWDATRFRVLGISGTVNSQNFAGSPWYSLNLAIAYQFAFNFTAA